MTYKKSEKTRQLILDVSKQLFYKQGIKNTSVRQIATEVDLKNSGALYYYFASKEDIIQEIYSKCLANLHKLCDDLVDKNEKPLLNMFIGMKLHFKCSFYGERDKLLFLEIVDSAWFDNVIINQRKEVFFGLSKYCQSDITDEMIYIHVLATRGAGNKLIENKLKGKLNMEEDKLFNYILSLYPHLLAISNETIEQTLIKTDEIINAIEIKPFIFL